MMDDQATRDAQEIVRKLPAMIDGMVSTIEPYLHKRDERIREATDLLRRMVKYLNGESVEILCDLMLEAEKFLKRESHDNRS